MSDTSTLIAIKYKGQMINLPGDSSVSWNDLEDKPVVIKQGGTQTVTHYYDIVSYQPIRQLTQSGSGYGDNSYGGDALYVHKQSITNAINALSSQLSDDQKNIWRIEWAENGDDEWEIEATINIDNEEVLYFSGDHGITLRDEYLDDDGSYWKILVNDPNSLLDDDIPVSVDIIPVNFITSDNQTVTSLSYTETIVVPGQWYFDPDHIEKDASVGILWDTSMNGGSADLSDYYTKTQIDTSIANNYASNNDISAFITSNDVSIYLTDNDISTFITANDVSNKLEANDVSIYLTSNDVSQFASKSDVSVLDTSVSQLWDTSTQGGGVSIQYLTQAEYNNLQTKDPNTLYLIEESV